MVLPRLIEAAINNRPLEVYGDGKQQRVFCHVIDAVDAINKLISSSNANGQVFNIGGLQEISILDLAKLVINELNSKSEIVFHPYDQAYGVGFEDMLRRVPDLTKIKDLVSWSPKINLTEIIKDISLALS